MTTNRYKDVYYVCFSDPPFSPAEYLELIQCPSTARSPPMYRLDSLLESFTDSNNSESDSDSAVVSPTYRRTTPYRAAAPVPSAVTPMTPKRARDEYTTKLEVAQAVELLDCQPADNRKSFNIDADVVRMYMDLSLIHI